MEETLTSQKMAKIDLINSLEKISSEIPDRILNFKLYKAPLREDEENFIRENQNSVFFLNQKNWI